MATGFITQNLDPVKLQKTFKTFSQLSKGVSKSSWDASGCPYGKSACRGSWVSSKTATTIQKIAGALSTSASSAASDLNDVESAGTTGSHGWDLDVLDYLNSEMGANWGKVFDACTNTLKAARGVDFVKLVNPVAAAVTGYSTRTSTWGYCTNTNYESCQKDSDCPTNDGSPGKCKLHTYTSGITTETANEVKATLWYIEQYCSDMASAIKSA